MAANKAHEVDEAVATNDTINEADIEAGIANAKANEADAKADEANKANKAD